MTTSQPPTLPVPTPRVVVIGTGTMGAAITRRLLAAGLTVAVWNRGQGRSPPSPPSAPPPTMARTRPWPAPAWC